MSTVLESPPILHPFESAGLGLVAFVGLTESVYQACPGAPAQPGGTCDYCGQGIRYVCEIRSADGRRFNVGCDCVRKVHRDDNRMLTAVERAQAKLNKEKRDADRAEKWRQQSEARDARLAAEREQNGGLTNQELAEKQREEARAAAEAEAIAKYEVENGWLLKVLRAIRYDSEFIASMIDRVSRGPINGLSDRCVDILRSIYGKAHGRGGSKRFNAACDEFDTRVTGGKS